MSKELNQFCKNYEVRVVNDTGRHARYSAPQFFTNPSRADIIQDHVEYQTEKLYTLQIPESRLNTLMEMERRFFNAQKYSDRPVAMFEVLMEKEREEAHFRYTNAAVQKAYEQYSIMLNLAGYQRKF
jgi:hypothetical protein